MSPRHTVALAALFLAAGVAAGAFGAHALRGRLPEPALATYGTAVLYHLVHALGLFALGALRASWRDARSLALASVLLAAGIVLFSGSLYALALTGVRAWGVVTPFGGAAWLAGWAAVAWTALTRREASPD